MLEKIKERYYRYGILIASDGKESENAEMIIEKYGVKMVKKNSIMYKICTILIPKIYLNLGNIYVFKAKNRSEAIKVTENFINFSNGTLLYSNI